jgi:hypothetical protein
VGSWQIFEAHPAAWNRVRTPGRPQAVALSQYRSSSPHGLPRGFTAAGALPQSSGQRSPTVEIQLAERCTCAAIYGVEYTLILAINNDKIYCKMANLHTIVMFLTVFRFEIALAQTRVYG